MVCCRYVNAISRIKDYHHHHHYHHRYLLYAEIYTYIPETNHVSREHCVAAILVLLFMVRISLVPALTPLYLYVSTFRSMCAVLNMAVFRSSVTSWFPGMLLTYFLNALEMVPVAPIITGITFVFTFHMRYISIIRSLYFRIFSASFLITFLSPEIATSINIHALLLLLLLLLSSSSSSSHFSLLSHSWEIFTYPGI